MMFQKGDMLLLFCLWQKTDPCTKPLELHLDFKLTEVLRQRLIDQIFSNIYFPIFRDSN